MKNWAEEELKTLSLGDARLERRTALLQAHAQDSALRMAAHPVVLCLQDTMELEFDARQAQGLGPLSYEARKVFVHPTRRRRGSVGAAGCGCAAP